MILPVEHTARPDTNVLDDVTYAEGTIFADSGRLGWPHVSVPPEMFPVERVTTGSQSLNLLSMQLGLKSLLSPLRDKWLSRIFAFVREGPNERGTRLDRKLMELRTLERVSNDRLHR